LTSGGLLAPCLLFLGSYIDSHPDPNDRERNTDHKRQPEAAKDISGAMILSAAFVEGATLFGVVVLLLAAEQAARLLELGARAAQLDAPDLDIARCPRR